MSLGDEIRSVLSDPLNLPAEFLDYLTQWQAINPIYTKPIEFTQFDATKYGIAGDGVTDDTSALQAFLNDFVKQSAGDIGHQGLRGIIPPGAYKITSKLSLDFPADNTTVKNLTAYGVRLYPTIASGHVFEISTSGSAQLRNLTVEGLMIDGTNAADTAGALIHVIGNGASLYRCVFRDVALEQFVGHGLMLDGSLVFETAVVTPHFLASGSNTLGSGLYLNVGGGQTDVYGGTMMNGLHNIFAHTGGGAKVHGGTYLTAYNEGILFDNCTEGIVVGAHVENAWQGGIASPSWLTTQSGITILGRATVLGCSGTQNNTKMRYVVRTNTGNAATVQGGVSLGGVDYYLRAEGGGTTTVIGIDQGVTDSIHDFGQGKIIRLGVRGTTSPIQVERGCGPRGGKSTLAYSASITPDSSAGAWQTTTVTNATAFTINAPTNPPDASHSQELTIEVLNSSGGAMGVITWNAIFVFAGLVWANPATTKKRYVTFAWNGAAWIAQSISGADY